MAQRIKGRNFQGCSKLLPLPTKCLTQLQSQRLQIFRVWGTSDVPVYGCLWLALISILEFLLAEDCDQGKFFEQPERPSTYSWIYNFDDSVYIKRTSNEIFLCYFFVWFGRSRQGKELLTIFEDLVGSSDLYSRRITILRLVNAEKVTDWYCLLDIFSKFFYDVLIIWTNQKAARGKENLAIQ